MLRAHLHISGDLEVPCLVSYLASILPTQLTLDLPARLLRISLHSGGQQYSIEVRFKHVAGALQLTDDGSLLLTLRLPPRVYRKQRRCVRLSGRQRST